MYRLKYKIDFETGEFTKEDSNNNEFGLTDALLLVSVLTEGKAHEGNASVAFLSVDGRESTAGTPVPQPPTEMFMVWSMFGRKLMEEYKDKLPSWQFEILEDAFEATKKKIVHD